MTEFKEHKREKIIYWTGIVFIACLFLPSGIFEITKNPAAYLKAINLGYPPHFILLLGIAKISGVIVLFFPAKFNWLKDWVFAGLAFDVIFAFNANVYGGPAGEVSHCVIATVFLIIILITYRLFHKINPIVHVPF